MTATTVLARTSHSDKALESLAELAKLAISDISASVGSDLGEDLHRLFDSVSDAALPIYFGPLLGRLYLQGL